MNIYKAIFYEPIRVALVCIPNGGVLLARQLGHQPELFRKMSTIQNKLFLLNKIGLEGKPNLWAELCQIYTLPNTYYVVPLPTSERM